MRALEVVRRLGGEVAAQRLEKRAAKLSSDRLVDWAESSVPSIGRALNDWTSAGRDEGLQEARMATAALLTVLEELEGRRAAGRL